MEIVVFLLIIALIVVSMWKVFVKAGQPGWACLVPIYNIVVLCRIGGKPGWWVLLFIIPIVGLIFSIMVTHGVSKRFGHDIGMTLMLIFLPFIAYPMLAFGDSVYLGQPKPAQA